jgi:hypothetical protein
MGKFGRREDTGQLNRRRPGKIDLGIEHVRIGDLFIGASDADLGAVILNQIVELFGEIIAEQRWVTLTA